MKRMLLVMLCATACKQGLGDRCQVDSDCPSGLTCQKSPPAICVKPNMMGADANVAIDTPQAGDAPTDSKPADAGGLD